MDYGPRRRKKQDLGSVKLRLDSLIIVTEVAIRVNDNGEVKHCTDSSLKSKIVHTVLCSTTYGAVVVAVVRQLKAIHNYARQSKGRSRG